MRKFDIYKNKREKNPVFMLKSLLLFLALLGPVSLRAQLQTTPKYYAQLKNMDLSKLWRGDSVYSEFEGESSYHEYPEPIGFIGDNYQRFYIHLISVSKNSNKPYTYDVKGKTKVGQMICSFSGTITITNSEIFSGPTPRYNKRKNGFLTASVKFYEDSLQKKSGVFEGVMKTNWVAGKDQKIMYDAIELSTSDGFCNNQFIGTWTSYKRKAKKDCRWGDYRIPECGGLDIGVGEFSVREEFIKNGWQDYSPNNHGKKWW